MKSTPHPMGAFASSALAWRKPPVVKESLVPKAGRGSSKLLPSAQLGDHESETSARGLSSFQC